MPKILVVDDNPNYAKILCGILNFEGYITKAIHHGEEILTVLSEYQPDLILLDVLMPGENGFEVCSRIKEEECYREIPVIFLSAKDRKEEILQGFKVGGVDYVTKPCNSQILLARVSVHAKLRTKGKLLVELASIDPLTNLANRRKMDEFMEMSLRQCDREKQAFSVLMIDIDYFKSYNDTYGHIKGDRVLERVANCLESHANRYYDLVVRYGGEEFVIILGNADEKVVTSKAAEIIKSVESMNIFHEDSSVSKYLTVSIGGVTISPGSNNESSTIIEEADQALYRAKEKGRNQFSI